MLKVAHHGSEDLGLPGLLRELRPRVAVISVGKRNDYGHPRPETLAALKEQLSPGEADDVCAQLPRDLKEVWEDA